MAFRIPFNEHLVIEADSPAEVRALITEFGVTLGSARLLPAPPPAIDVVEEPRTEHRAPAPKPTPSPVARRTTPRTARAEATSAGEDVMGGVFAKLMQALGKGPQPTQALADAIGGSRFTATRALKQMHAKGLVHSTGATISLRWHLGAKGASPKEAESGSRR